MANIAILGSSYSDCLYRHVHEDALQALPHDERKLRRTQHGRESAFDLIPVESDYKNHWVNMLSTKYPQHTFHVFAKGGSGWEYTQQLLYMLSNSNICDRVIIELQNYRAMILSENISFNSLADNTVFLDYEIFHETENTLVKWYHLINGGNWWFDHLEKGLVDSSYDKMINLMKNKYQLNSNNSKLNFTNEVLEYIARMIVSPVYIIRYQQYLLSLMSVWPKIFDKVGIWAFESFDLPYLTDFNANKEFFNNKVQLFDETMWKDWIKEDPINNSVDSWKDKYFGFDGFHLNREGMELLVDFLLKQSNIQQVLK
tara:strand:+ start:244 stop:1185 length:942 start_codon:yes stop_codon:yes gene_type:complete